MAKKLIKNVQLWRNPKHHNEFTLSPVGLAIKSLSTPLVAKDVGKLGPSCIAGGNVKWFRDCEK